MIMTGTFEWDRISLKEIKAVVVAKPQVENNQARVRSREVTIQIASVGRGTHWDILFLEIIRHQASYRFVIVDHNDVAVFLRD
jgi:hypothetical protein